MAEYLIETQTSTQVGPKEGDLKIITSGSTFTLQVYSGGKYNNITDYSTSAEAASNYVTLLSVSGSHIAAKVAGTYALGFGDPLAVSGTGTLYPIGIIGLAAADYNNLTGYDAKLRIRAQLNVNDVAPTGDYTLGLYPITRPATSGGAGLNIFTLGTVVTGSNGATVSTPAADSQNDLVSSTFDIPTDGQYVIGCVTTATVAADSLVHINAHLQLVYEAA